MRRTTRLATECFFVLVYYLVLAALWLALPPAKAKADDQLKLCRSPYALMSENFKYGQYKAQLARVKAYTVVTLWNTFGNKTVNLERELQDPRVTGVELILFNETCVTRGDCGKYETLYGYGTGSLAKAIMSDNPKLKAKLIAESERAAAFLLPRLRDGQGCWVNPLLETHQRAAAATRVASWVMPAFGGRCRPVWNPAGGKPGPAVFGYDVSEGHGDAPQFAPGACIANPDGTLIGEAEYNGYLLRYGQRCEFACTWGLADNCAAAGQPRLDPRKRPCKDTGEFKVFGRVLERAQQLGSVPPWDSNDDKSLAGCAKVNANPDGARRGFLSKESEVGNYGWTILFPAEFKKFKIVQAVKAGKVLAFPWSFYYFYTEDGSNRAVWRAEYARGRPVKASQFPPNIVVRGQLPNGKWQCWKVHDPRVRND